LILLLAILLGWIAGLCSARVKKRPYQLPPLRLGWLVAVGMIPQLLAFQVPATRGAVPEHLASLALIASQACLLLFAWYNRKQSGFALLFLGTLMNLTVILMNGGWMPLSVPAAARLFGEIPSEEMILGARIGASKDMLLEANNIRLEWLSDRFITPDGFPFRVAFSAGDVLIGSGAFWFVSAIQFEWSAALQQFARWNRNIFPSQREERRR
jgi:hypothetical protein